MQNLFQYSLHYVPRTNPPGCTHKFCCCVFTSEIPLQKLNWKFKSFDREQIIKKSSLRLFSQQVLSCETDLTELVSLKTKAEKK